MAGESELSESQVRLALAYYDSHSDEIDEAIAENRRPLDDLVEQYPFITTADAPRP
jgi:hypothetical protein